MSVGQSPALTSLCVAAGPQSIINCWSPTSMAKDEPNRVGVGVGVPAPRTCIFVISLVSPPDFRDSKIAAEEQAKFSRNLTDCTILAF